MFWTTFFYVPKEMVLSYHMCFKVLCMLLQEYWMSNWGAMPWPPLMSWRRKFKDYGLTTLGGKETVRDRSRSPLRYDGPDPAVKPESHSAWRTAQVLLLWHCFEVFVWEWFSKPAFSSSAAAQVLLLVRKRWGLFPNALAVQAHVLEFEHEHLIGGLVCCLGVSSCFNSMVLGFILFASPARLPSIPRWIWKWRQWRRWESTWKWQWGWGEPREEGSDWWWSHGWQEGGEELVATCSNWYCNLTIKFLM